MFEFEKVLANSFLVFDLEIPLFIEFARALDSNESYLDDVPQQLFRSLE